MRSQELVWPFTTCEIVNQTESLPEMELLEDRRFLSAVAASATAPVVSTPAIKAAVTLPKLSPQDVKWMMRTASSELLEVMLGKVMKARAATGIVKDFGSTMIRDHSLSDTLLRQLGASLGVSLPNSLDSEDQQSFNQITRNHGIALDKAYASFMVQDHQKDITEFTQEYNGTANPLLKGFTQQNSQTLHIHLFMAKIMDATVNGSNPLTAADRQWILDTASSERLETKLGALAMSQASDSDVKVFGARMVSDHSVSLNMLRKLADTLHVIVPNSLNTEDTATYNQFAKLHGAAFDKAYAHLAVSDHQNDIADFTAEAKNTRSAALKTFASLNLPILQMHLALAQLLNDQVNNGGGPGVF